MKTIVIDGVIGWDTTGRDVRRQLKAAGATEDIRAEISTVGGSVLQGIEIHNRLRDHKGHVTTHIMSHAASMGSYISLAGDKVTAEDNAIFMVHNVSGLGVGDHREMRARADLFEGLSAILAKGYADKTGKPIAEIRAMMDKETFLFGDEMKDEGFVDEISANNSDATKADAVALIKLALEDCDAKMKDASEQDDTLQIAAMIKGQTVPTQKGADVEQGDTPDNTIPASKGGELNQEAVMDLQKLKAEHPALYAQVLQEGKEAGAALERDRVKGHLTMAKNTDAVDFAHECIEGGKGLTESSVVAGYMSAGFAKRDVDNRDDDNPDGDLSNNDDQDSTAAGAELLDSVMALSKKSGAAVNPDNKEA